MKSIQKILNLGIAGILLFVFFTSSMNDESYKQSQLINKEWKAHSLVSTNFTIDLYADKEMKTTKFFDGVKLDEGIKCSYYLSDVIVDKFQPENVGTNKSGKYIVRLTEDNTLHTAEILELTDTMLIIRDLKSGSILRYIVVEKEK